MTKGKEIKRVMMGVCSVASGLLSTRPRKATISVATPRGGCWPGTTSRKVGVFNFQEEQDNLASVTTSPEAVLDLEHLFQCSRKADSLAQVRVSVKGTAGEIVQRQTPLYAFLSQMTWLGRGGGFHLIIEDGGLSVKPLLRLNDENMVTEIDQNTVSSGSQSINIERKTCNTENDDVVDTVQSTESASDSEDKVLTNEIPIIVDLNGLDLDDDKEVKVYKIEVSSTDNEPSVVYLLDCCDVFDNELNYVRVNESEQNDDCAPINIEANNPNLSCDKSYCITERNNVEDATRVEESHGNSHCRRGHAGGTVFRRVMRYICRAVVITVTVVVLIALLDPLLPPLAESPIEWF